MKNKAYDLEFWRKPGESDAETRERVYRYLLSAKIYGGFSDLLSIFDCAAVAFWDTIKAISYLLIATPIAFFAAPFYYGRAFIRRYLILLRIGAITWYGKRTEKMAPNKFKPYDIVYAKMRDNDGVYFIAEVNVINLDNEVQFSDNMFDFKINLDTIRPHFVSSSNMWATIEEAEQATGLEYKFKTKNLLFNE